jgi:hypothetical protein
VPKQRGRPLRLAGTWVCCAAVAVSVVAILTGLPGLILLWRNPASTEGVVTRVDLVNHGATTARYTIGAKQYRFFAVSSG